MPAAGRELCDADGRRLLAAGQAGEEKGPEVGRAGGDDPAGAGPLREHERRGQAGGCHAGERLEQRRFRRPAAAILGGDESGEEAMLGEPGESAAPPRPVAVGRCGAAGEIGAEGREGVFIGTGWIVGEHGPRVCLTGGERFTTAIVELYSGSFWLVPTSFFPPDSFHQRTSPPPRSPS